VTRAGLTAAQRAFLVRAERHTFPDGTGGGAFAYGGVERLVAGRLSAKGLVTLPAAWTAFSGAKITPAGRAALAATDAPSRPAGLSSLANKTQEPS
jgi:hypothetical protein